MHSDLFIERVRDAANIVDLCQKYTKLKQKGANFIGLSPFNKEKTPSFTVSPVKGIFKCFSSGKGGDCFKFIQEIEGLSFPAAIDFLANLYNIPPEHKDPEAAKRYEKQKSALELIQWAHSKYLAEFAKLPPEHWAKQDITDKRGLPIDVAIDWQIGFAPNTRIVCDHVVPNGMLSMALDAGLAGTNERGNYDLYIERQIIPIHNAAGKLVGFAGKKDPENEKVSKYINPPDTDVYQKSNVLFGLNRASKAIAQQGFAYLVEGYWDVIAMHEYGVVNTVAGCGTGFSQAKLLKKYTNRVVILFDGDGPGIKAIDKSIKELLAVGIKPEVCLLPENLDPCDFCKKATEKDDIQNLLKQYTQDAIIYKARILLDNAGDDPLLNGEAVTRIADMVYQFNNEQTRENYCTLIRNEFKIKADILRKRFKELDKEKERAAIENLNLDDNFSLPEGVNAEEVMRYGFYHLDEGYKTGYYFLNNEKQATQLTNFYINPLFHIYSKEDNKRLIEIKNPLEKRILELPSKGFISLDQFTAAMFDQGWYVTYAGFSKHHLQKIVGKIGREFPLCYELRSLGWQSEGFFAFSNCIYGSDLVHYDNKGIVSFKDVNYYSPSASDILAIERKDKDEYENDRYLRYSQAPISFGNWARLLINVYGTKGMLGISFSIVTLFRDIFFKLEGFCPHLYCYGQAQSGKSVFSKSISNLFFHDMPGFNLNQGTDFAFWHRLERFRNCPVVFNEFDENEIKEEWFRGIKAIYDGEGRERGRNKNKTETQQVTSTVILVGQYLSSKDDGAVLTRCIITEFEQVNERSQELQDNFMKLKECEERGLSSLLVDMLKHREQMLTKASVAYSDIKKSVRESLKIRKKKYKDRIANNYSYLLTAAKVMGEYVDLGFTYNDFYEFCITEIARLSNIIAESNALADFWKTLEFLLDSEQVISGYDFRIETLNKVNIVEDNKDTTLNFTKPKKVIFIRLNNIHKKYLEVHRRQKGGVGINEQTLLLYIKTEPSFIGSNRSSRFRGDKGSMSTSSFVFDYEELCKVGINLERTPDDMRPLKTVQGAFAVKPTLAENTGTTLIKFKLITTETYKPDADTPEVTRKTFTDCVDHNLENLSIYESLKYVEVTGLLSERVWKDDKGKEHVSRLLEVTNIINKPDPKEIPNFKTESDANTDDMPF